MCIECDGQLVASSSSLILDFDPKLAWHDWKAIADGGYIRNHNTKGDTLYGIEIMVDPEYRGLKLSRRLYDARKELCRNMNLARMIIGGRIPGYGHHAEQMTAREYVEKVMAKALYDPVLTAQLSNGFALAGPDSQLLSDGHGIAWLRDVSGMAESGLQVRVRSDAITIRSNRSGSASCSIRCGRSAVLTNSRRSANIFLDVASDYKCDFILFPELVTTQLLSCVEPTRPGLAARRLADFTPQYLEFFTEMSVKYDINVIGGSHFVVEQDTLYNIAFLFQRDGSINKQYKLHITPSEQKWWGVTGGNKLEVFDTDCGRIGIQICYDIEFPELSRIAARKGAEMIFVPYNTDTRHGYLRVRHCAQARCVENHLYVATSGCTGNLPFVENADIHYAQSGIYTPADVAFARDAVAAECNPNVETVIIHDLGSRTAAVPSRRRIRSELE